MSLKNHSWRKVVQALGEFGYVTVSQSASHIILRNSKGVVVSVARHDPLPEGTLTAILAEAEIEKEEFVKELYGRRK